MQRLLMMALLLPLLAGCATHVASSSAVVLQDDSGLAHEGFSGRDRRLILDYYQHHKREQQGTPTGLVRRDVLPPTLPSRQLPAALEAQLTPLLAGYTRLEVGSDVILINRNSRVIIDIIYGVGA